MRRMTTFKWNKTWEDGKDHSKEVGLEQYFLRMCKNCGKRRGLHIDSKKSCVFERSLLEKYALCP